ncbi:MAG: sulfatase [Acidobacteriota bacterium]|nr:MAG: sulfatase [Acidobacteriota bacterium]
MADTARKGGKNKMVKHTDGRPSVTRTTYRRESRGGPLLAALVSLLGALACAPAPTDNAPLAREILPERPNVIVLLVDTLRADGLGFGGYDKDTSPRLDAWASRGVVFDGATTPAGWTRPAVVSLFTGLNPASHGVQDKEHIVPDDLVTLAEVFRAGGYFTAAFVTNFAASHEFGCDQGFDKFRWFDKKIDSPPEVPKQLNYVPVGHIDEEIRAFFANPPRQPYFAYVHTTDPHYPYMPPVEYLKFGSSPRGRYDGEVRYTDEILGGWLEYLDELGALERSIVVLTSDHGEEFREHGGTGHGITVFEECVRVPLVVWAPGLTPGRRRALVSLADLGPTLLEAARVLPAAGFGRQGRSFWSVALGQDPPSGWSWAYHELVYPSKGITFAYREGPEKVVHIVQDRLGRSDRTYLFRVSEDPFEQNDLSQQLAERTAQLRDKMRAVRAEHERNARASVAQPLDEEAVEQLRAMGYID